ncbi:MAG: phosphoenolpyruvate synthase [Spirochaetes bacterium]|nr:phosphoenolpyruvate synthase [Spirochaetota bacterium]
MRTAAILWFDEIDMRQVPTVGGKNASLGEMTQNLRAAGIEVPFGFATTAAAYREFLQHNGIADEIAGTIAAYRAGSIPLSVAGKKIRAMLLAGKFPEHTAGEIRAAYAKLSGTAPCSVAVRSSATAEDLPDASFAGQQETFLNITGSEEVITGCIRCYASLFTDRAIVYRESKGFDHMKVYLSAGVQKMVRSDLASAGVMFTIDTETGFPGTLTINAAWGLGESVVQGIVDPDEYRIFKPSVPTAFNPVLAKRAGANETKLVYGRGAELTETVPTTRAERESFVLNDFEIHKLARWALAIEKHYGKPMDIEWAKDGVTGELFIVQARPETVQARRDANVMERFKLKEQGTLLASGLSIGEKIAAGQACVILDAKDIAKFRPGSVLVARNTDPDWVPVMKKASGIVTDHGGRTSHAAIVSRELGIPAVIGCGNATQAIRDGQEITLSCTEGNAGKVYNGALAFEVHTERVDQLPPTRTKIMVNLANPDGAAAWWRLPTDGVGLARMEFIITDRVKIHPLAAVYANTVTDEGEQAAIRRLTHRYPSAREYFIEELCAGIAQIAAAQHPKPVILRMSDFKTNEYANLIGGKYFEHAEENPMIGFRGASRYYSDNYHAGFALECEAVKRVRNEKGLTNVHVMIPFVRTVSEADWVIEELADNGLVRGANGLKFYMMAEIPANAILAESFATRFDGFSIGSNDLTQLTLGIDRDSEMLSYLFDERNEAVKELIRQIIHKAHLHGTTVGICGRAPSDYPEFCEFLIREGIDSISVDPEKFIATRKQAAAIESGAEPVAADPVHADVHALRAQNTVKSGHGDVLAQRTT